MNSGESVIMKSKEVGLYVWWREGIRYRTGRAFSTEIGEGWLNER